MGLIMEFKYNRILIVGCGGAGKSTLAREMGDKFNIPVIHLDKLHWLPNWIERPDSEFYTLLEKELEKPRWIIDGNYTRTFEWRLQYADLCIFLDYPIDLCLTSIDCRVKMYSGKSRPDMTEGCIERADDEFVEWINSYIKNVRPKFLEILNKYSVPYLIFTSRNQTAEWLNQFN